MKNANPPLTVLGSGRHRFMSRRRYDRWRRKEYGRAGFYPLERTNRMDYEEAMERIPASDRPTRQARRNETERTMSATENPMSMEHAFLVHQIEEDDGTIQWICEFPDLKGCVGVGNTYDEAVSEGMLNKEVWIETAKEVGRN